MTLNSDGQNPRPRGILSPADRKFIVSSEEEREEEYSRSAQSQREKAIRERVEHGIRDFVLLSSHLDRRDRAKIADELGMDDWAEAPDYSMVGAPQGVTHAIAFLYLVYRDAFDGEQATESFEDTVGNGVGVALSKELEGLWNADVNIDPERVPRLPNRDRIREKILGEHEGGLNVLETQWIYDKLVERYPRDDIVAMIDAPTPIEEINRGRSEGKLSLDRMKRLHDEDVTGIEAFPDPYEWEKQHLRTPYDDLDGE